MILLLTALAIAAGPGTPPPAQPAKAHGPPPTHATVVKVYDGDTCTLDSGDKVRLAYVNTPELKPHEDFGPEAGDYTRGLILDQEVQLVFSREDPRDGYGRLVAGVRLGEQDLALGLLERGLAHVYVIPPVEIDLAPLLAAEAQARAAHLGIWSLERYQGPLHITSFHADAKGNDMENVNGEYFRLANISGAPLDLSRYAIKDAGGSAWLLPAVTLPAGHTVKVMSGKGDNQADPTQQIAIYLGSDTPIWNNAGDLLQVLGPDKAVVDSREHRPSSPAPHEPSGPSGAP
ncbi:MAG: thermonuclease family protein [Deltaproteobacteria bacterium]|nr:thermonuclease family protein [Deltaproteobacteria bacterium]